MDTTCSFGPLTRRSFLKAGLIGSAGLVAGGVIVGTAPPAVAADQAEWRWCHKCQ
jgi:hypothetical protein